MKRDEIRVGVRSGTASDSTNRFRRVKVAIVSGGSRPMLWLGGEGQYDGIAWISGRDTLRRIRDALTEALELPGGDT